MNTQRIKKMTVLAMLCAVAFIVTIFGMSIMPQAPFLKLEFKDAIIVIAGFMYGPLASLAIAVIVALIELFTISEAGVIGAMMNILSSVAFSCTASIVYRKHRSIKGASVGLVSGVLLMTAMMILWNYTMTPIYMGIDRQVVVDMLIPVFLPFNLLKGTFNAAIALGIYKPLTTALRSAKLLPASKKETQSTLGIGTLLVSVALLVSCIFVILIIQGKI